MKILYKLRKLNLDKCLSMSFALTFLFSAIMSVLSSSENVNDFSVMLRFFQIPRLLFMILGATLVFFLRRFNKILFYYFIGVVFLFSLSVLTCPDNSGIIAFTVKTYITAFILSAMTFSIVDYEYLIKVFLYCSYVFVWFLLIFLLWVMQKGLLQCFASDSYMVLSYSVLPFASFLIYDFLKRKKIFSLLSFFIGISIMLLWGSRGALLSLITYGIVIFIRFCIQKRRYFMLVNLLVMVIFAFVLLYNFSGEISNYLQREYGIKSYIINSLFKRSDNLKSFSSNRTVIYEGILTAIDKNPIEFKGITADYNVNRAKIYSHNIFLELLYCFGCLFGSFFSLVIVFLLIFTISLKKNNAQNDLAIFFLVNCFIRLLVSSSLFLNIFFWCWLMLIYKIYFIKHGKANEFVRINNR